jgi:hypothetical protein
VASSPAPFRPSPIDREAVEVPLAGRLARQAPDEARRARDRALAQHRRLSTLGSKNMHRLLRGSIGGGLLFGLVGWLLVDGSAWGLLYFTLSGALAGAAVALMSLGTGVSAGVFLAISGAWMLLRDVPSFFGLAVFGVLGAAFAIGEAGWQSDGD